MIRRQPTPPAAKPAQSRTVFVLGALILGTAGCSDSDPPAAPADTVAAADTAAEVDSAVAPTTCTTDAECADKLASVPCRKAVCYPDTGACGLAVVDDGSACDDGSSCTSDDRCQGGVCTGVAQMCEDNDPCTDNLCGDDGCFFANNTAPCDDGNPCTTQDTCTAGVCFGQARDCDDGNPCTDDACDEEGGCVHTNNTAPCLDGNGCTIEDVCVEGECRGQAVPGCLNLNPECGDGVCDEIEDCNSCEADCPTCCSAEQIPNCNGGCTTASWVDDGVCDGVLNCSETNWDGGDCEPECGFDGQFDCNGNCAPIADLGNGRCHGGSDGGVDYNCSEFDFDGGDCPLCPDDAVAACIVRCVPAELLENGVCDEELNCAKHEEDNNVCCPPMQTRNCGGTCVSAAIVGDGTCNAAMNCEATGFDGGDCPQ